MRSLPEPPPRLAGATCAMLSSGSVLACSLLGRDDVNVTVWSLTTSILCSRSTAAILERATSAAATSALAAAAAATAAAAAAAAVSALWLRTPEVAVCEGGDRGTSFGLAPRWGRWWTT